MNQIDFRAVRRHFGRAAKSYEAAAALQREVESRLLENLTFAKADPEVVLDLGSGPGHASAALKKRWPKAAVIALDAALPMLIAARANQGWLRRFSRVAGDARALPLREGSIDLLFSNLCLQWCPDLPPVLDEFRRVLRPGALLLFSTFGPATLHELRSAFAQVDAAPHVAQFPDLPVIGDALLAAGFRNPVVDLDTITTTYADARALMRELKSLGATNAAAGRASGLGGRRRIDAACAAYEAHRIHGRLPATWEIITAMAFAPEPGQPRRARDGAQIAAFDVDKLRGSRVRREG
jgi:malonyl-CoA O-methyltransferase